MGKATIVLLRGMFGFSRILWWEYFHGAPKMLEAMGFEVRVPATPWGARIERRAAFLAEALKDCTGPVHLIGHSMGGLDARYYITYLGGHARVASLTTISTPHHGSILATRSLSAPLSPWKHIPSVTDLSRESLTRFNEATPDMPGVIYRSYSAARPLSELPWWIRPYGRRISEAKGANDSLVSVDSATRGKHIATLQADHFELIGSHVWLNPFRRRVPFNHLALYRDIGEWIQRTKIT